MESYVVRLWYNIDRYSDPWKTLLATVEGGIEALLVIAIEGEVIDREGKFLVEGEITIKWGKMLIYLSSNFLCLAVCSRVKDL